MMKYFVNKTVLVVSIILFVGVTLFTMDLGGMSDGLTRIGFPLVFMQDTGGKCIDCSSIIWFKWHVLVIDILFSIGLAGVIVKLAINNKSIIVITLLTMLILNGWWGYKISTFSLFDDTTAELTEIVIPDKPYKLKLYHVPSNATSQSYIQVNKNTLVFEMSR